MNDPGYSCSISGIPNHGGNYVEGHNTFILKNGDIMLNQQDKYHIYNRMNKTWENLTHFTMTAYMTLKFRDFYWIVNLNF